MSNKLQMLHVFYNKFYILDFWTSYVNIIGSISTQNISECSLLNFSFSFSRLNLKTHSSIENGNY